jgi:predicted RNA-binding protein YlxR (DUF448 family)
VTAVVNSRQRPRTCAACKEEAPKRALIRVVRSPGGVVVVDERGKLPGRGAYLCANQECVEKARKTKALSRALKTEIPNELYERLKEYVETYREIHGGVDVRELRALLGLSRRANLLYIGIDSVKSQYVKEPLLILTAADASDSIKDAVRKQVDGGGDNIHVYAPLEEKILSAAIGAMNVQVVALPARSGLADKIKMLIS